MSEPTLIDITPGKDGYRVWIGNRVYGEFATMSNAARVAAAIHTIRNLPPMRPSPVLVVDNTPDVAAHNFNLQMEHTL